MSRKLSKSKRKRSADAGGQPQDGAVAVRPWDLNAELAAMLDRKRNVAKRLAVLEGTIHHLEGSYLVDVHDPGNVIRGYPALTGILHVSAGATAAVEGATASVAESSLASTQRRSMRATTTSSPVNAMDTSAAMGTAAEDSSSSSPLKLTRFATVHDVPETLRLFSHSSVTAMEALAVADRITSAVQSAATSQNVSASNSPTYIGKQMASAFAGSASGSLSDSKEQLQKQQQQQQKKRKKKRGW